MFSAIRTTLFASLLLALTVSAEIVVKNGESIAFLGDSITALGNSSGGGYVNLVIAGLKANGVDAVKIPAGISGHKSNQMLARLKKDVLSKNPKIMTLSCGVNDVWHKQGVALEDYKKNITSIVEQAQAAGITVCIMTATMITENPTTPGNVKLDTYNEFLRELAAEKKCLLAETNLKMKSIIADFRKKYPEFKGNFLTYDGVHMNAMGDEMMAEAVLNAFGLDEAQIKTAKAFWQRNAKKSSIGKIQFSAADVNKLIPLAAKKKMTVQQYIEYVIATLPAESTNP